MSKERYILKQTREPKRGENGTIPAWYVYDTKEKCRYSATSIVERYAKDLCDSLNKSESLKNKEKSS